MKIHNFHNRRFNGESHKLRSKERLALLEVNRVVEKCVEGIKVQNVLDIGTGTGVFAEAFSRLSLSITGIDINEELLHLARREVPDAKFILAPAEKLPFKEKMFDLVFLGLVLHETDDPTQTLVEARRVARFRTAILEWPYLIENQGPPLHHRLRPEKIERMAKEAGLTSIERIKLSHMHLFRLHTHPSNGGWR